MQISKVCKQVVAPAIALVCAAAIAHLQLAQVTATEQKAKQGVTKAEAKREEAQYKTTMALLKKLPSSSYDNLIADYAFLNVIQYFGDEEARPKTGYSATPDFFEVAVQRDPLFLDMYSYLSAMVTLYGGKPQKSVDLIGKGLSAIPNAKKADAYFLWQAKAQDELLFLGKPQAARQSYLQAADWASQSQKPELKQIAQRSRQTAQFLASNPNSKVAQASAWANIFSSAIDEPTRGFAARQIEALGGRVSVTDDGLLSVQLPTDKEGQQE
ncbi:MAG: hypothetical protein WA902_06830 [Thermosynechococcaceae cyanobacterium]